VIWNERARPSALRRNAADGDVLAAKWMVPEFGSSCPGELADQRGLAGPFGPMMAAFAADDGRREVVGGKDAANRRTRFRREARHQPRAVSPAAPMMPAAAEQHDQ